MQTFLPFANARQSARILDRARLGKQRVETLQIMTALVTGRGWVHHPAVKMWRGYESALLSYQYSTCREWRRRGYEDTCWDKTYLMFALAFTNELDYLDNIERPWWYGDEHFHRAHRSALLRKDPVFYCGLAEADPTLTPDEPYWWPDMDAQELRPGKPNHT